MAEAYDYPYDPTGIKGTNFVKDFPVKLDRNTARAFALTGPFFGRSLSIRSKLNPSIVLQENVDYRLLYIHEELFDLVDSPVYSIVYFFNKELNGEYLADFNLLGGNRQGNASIIKQMIDNIKNDSRDIYLENIIDFPSVLPPEGHLHHIANTYGYENAIDVFNQILAYLRAADTDLGLNITTQINGINEKYNELLALITSMEDENTEGYQELLTAMEQITTDLNGLRERVLLLEDGFSTFKQTTVSDIEKANAEIKSNRDGLALFKTSTSDTLASINNTIDVFNGKFTNIDSELSKLDTFIEETRSSLTDKQEQISELTDRVQVNEDDIAALKRRANEADGVSSSVARVLTGSTNLVPEDTLLLANHVGPHILPALSSVEMGQLIQVWIDHNVDPTFQVRNNGSERISYQGFTDTVVKLDDKYSMTFIKKSATQWGLYV